ncbi:MAG TPA: hypothetical protein VLJ21_05010 [Candidatus Binatia bacterium]|nr:hypothetical protein [Candidatus Binatia bacterium]
MKRGQILGRQLVIIGSWVVLLITLAIVFLLQSFAATNTGALEATNTATASATLASYLRQTTTYNAQPVPMAEALAAQTMIQDEASFKKNAEQFLALVKSAESRALIVTIPGETIWTAGERQAVILTSVAVKIPRPDNKEIIVNYVESEAPPEDYGGGA